MENQYDFKLIDGIFSPTDAGKVLTTLINNKINYHNLEDFSNHIRFNNDLKHSKKRVMELNQSTEDIKKILELAESNGFNLLVKSTIDIKFVK
ncbi:hypothetical protein [Flavobacterium myungsuense]|uniref:Uncharacterized protein n=1 Tax=Flavobacterium myungsuense TaxID=651823 RepID=A0ABW3J0F6_9FLAO